MWKILVALGALSIFAAGPCVAQTQGVSPLGVCDATVQTQLSQQPTRWTVKESWNSDSLTYAFQQNGRFQSNTGHFGDWTQCGARVVMDWPSYGAIYVGVITGDTISGTALLDAGGSIGTFVLTRIR